MVPLGGELLLILNNSNLRSQKQNIFFVKIKGEVSLVMMTGVKLRTQTPKCGSPKSGGIYGLSTGKGDNNNVCVECMGSKECGSHQKCSKDAGYICVNDGFTLQM